MRAEAQGRTAFDYLAAQFLDVLDIDDHLRAHVTQTESNKDIGAASQNAHLCAMCGQLVEHIADPRGSGVRERSHCASPASRSATPMLAPTADKTWQRAMPVPPHPPVTSATFPSRPNTVCTDGVDIEET
jgi:hypothetical protein